MGRKGLLMWIISLGRIISLVHFDCVKILFEGYHYDLSFIKLIFIIIEKEIIFFGIAIFCGKTIEKLLF
jgi:hypothetical protein